MRNDDDDTTTYVYLPALLVNLQVSKCPYLSEYPYNEGGGGAPPKQRRYVVHREEKEKERKGYMP